jgi:hypothetical protein
LELVSQGEYFALTADLLTSAGNATERDLRLYGLAVALRPLSRARGEPAAESLAGLARAAGERIADGGAAADTGGFAALLREAAMLLRSDAGAAARARLGPALDDLTARLAAAHPTPAASRPVHITASAPAAEPPIVPIESLAYDGEPALADVRPIVPIESLAPEPEPDARPIVPIESLAPEPAVPVLAAAPPAAESELTAFELAFRRYRQLLSGPAEAPALDPLLAAPEQPAPAAAAPATAQRAPEHAVEIASLCYHGRSALRRAVEVRHAIADQLARGVRPDAMQQLLDELLDLVPLALDDA